MFGLWWQVIAELQMSLSTVKEESCMVQQSLERKLEETQNQWDEERRQLNRVADQTSKVRNTNAHHLITTVSLYVCIYLLMRSRVYILTSNQY